MKTPVVPSLIVGALLLGLRPVHAEAAETPVAAAPVPAAETHPPVTLPPAPPVAASPVAKPVSASEPSVVTERAAASETAPITVTERFGGQVLLSDLAGATVGIVLASVAGPAGLLAFAFAAPAVHLAHGDGRGAAASFLLHLGAPVAGGIIGAKLESCTKDEWFCGLGGLIVGGLVGGVTASMLDATLLSSVTREERPRSLSGTRPSPTVAIAPNGGVVLGLAGTL